MADRIWKYHLPWETSFTLPLPPDARVLAVELQNDEPHVWVQLDPDHSSPPEDRIKKFHWVGTGAEVPDEARHYLGTVMPAGYVFHLFEEHAAWTR